MSKRWKFDLQRFADEDAPDEGQQNKPDEGQQNKPDDSDAPKTYSQDEVDDLIKKAQEEMAKDQAKAIADAKEEAKKLAKMNSEQKAQYEQEKKDQEIAQLKSQIEEFKRDALRANLSKTAAQILEKDHGIIATQDMLDFVTGEDADSTKENIAKLVGIIEADRKAQEEKRAMGRTPRSFGGSNKGETEIEKRLKKYM